jgi:hypothetical protein
MNWYLFGALVSPMCIAYGALEYFKPDFMKYTWWGKDPVHRKMVTEESFLRSTRKEGVILMILGCVGLLATLIAYLINKNYFF